MSATEQWYMAIGGHQVGPVAQAEIVANLRNGSIDAETLVFTAGMANWQRVRDVPAFAPFTGAAGTSAAGSLPPPTPPGRRSHDIDFVIHGNEMQFVEVELDPGEAAIAEAGAFMYMTPGVQMETIFGDGGKPTTGVVDALWGAGKRILTGESLFMTVFTNQGAGRHRVAFAAPYPGKILAMDLKSLGGQLVCQKDSFLCAARGVSLSIAFQRKIGAGLFGGEGFIMQRLEGDGLCFVHAGGTIHYLELAAGETMRVDTGCLVALQPSVRYDIQFVGKVKTALFGGEGIFFATLTGPGKVWLQSLPLSRMADRIYKAAPQVSRGRTEEGSVLDRAFGLGDMIDGR
ncbi:MAG: TIGR00266 family protein [Vicinamibacterales bacterium]